MIFLNTVWVEKYYSIELVTNALITVVLWAYCAIDSLHLKLNSISFLIPTTIFNSMHQIKPDSKMFVLKCVCNLDYKYTSKCQALIFQMKNNIKSDGQNDILIIIFHDSCPNSFVWFHRRNISIFLSTPRPF